jgi:hypothetical protein
MKQILFQHVIITLLNFVRTSTYKTNLCLTGHEDLYQVHIFLELHKHSEKGYGTFN